MLSWQPEFDLQHGAEVLCLGSHCDDIEIGCGGLIQVLAHRFPAISMNIVVFGATAERQPESEKAISRLLAGAENVKQTYFGFPNSFFPDHYRDIKLEFETLKKSVSPALIVTHYRKDRHQDHRTISDLTWNTFRDHMILEYEIPKYDGDLGRPNAYVALDSDVVDRKVDTLMRCFQSQLDRQWFTEETFRGFMRLRGIECNSASGYAEAFYAYKMRLMT